MRASFFSILLLFSNLLPAALPCFDLSLGGGVQHDQAWFTIFDPVAMTPVFNFKSFRLWIPYIRGEAGIGWNDFLLTYQADVGKGDWGKSHLSIIPQSTPLTFNATLSDSRLLNQRATLYYNFSFLFLHLVPCIGWNRFESHWKVGNSSPSFLPTFANDVGLVDVTLSAKNSGILQRLSGAFIGGDIGFSFGPLQATVGYKYTFGNFFTQFDRFSFNTSNGELLGTETIKSRSFSASGEGQIGNATIEWWLLPFLSVYFQGEGRWIQKRKGNLYSSIVESVITTDESRLSSKAQYEPFDDRWNCYDITLGARFSF